MGLRVGMYSASTPGRRIVAYVGFGFSEAQDSELEGLKENSGSNGGNVTKQLGSRVGNPKDGWVATILTATM